MDRDNPLQTIIEHLNVHGGQEFHFVGKSGTTRVSFAEMHERVVSGATAARRLGMQRGRIVAMVAENGYDAVWIDLVLMAAGATAVHIPDASLATSLEAPSCALDFVLATPIFQAKLEQLDHPKVGELGSLSVHVPKARAAATAKLADVPAIVFSSGTSGRVKQLLVSAPGILHHARVFYRFCEAGAHDSFLLFLPLSNYQQKLLVYGCILAGVHIHLADAQRVFDALRTTTPTLFLAPPVFYESALRLVRTSARDTAEPAKLSERLRALFGGRIRVMWCGMAPIARRILEEYNAAGLPLCEAYGMTEFGPVAANLPGANRIGAVGRPLLPGSVEISAEQEVLVTSPFPLTTDYLAESEEETRRVYVGPQQIATGDVGRLDEDGYLWISCRKKEVIITSGGQKVSPPELEQQFMPLEFVRHAVVMGDGRAFLGLLLIVHHAGGAEQAAVARKVEELNAGPCRAHPIRKWSLLEEEFSVDNGLLTRNFKINRQRVIERYEHAVFA